MNTSTGSGHPDRRPRRGDDAERAPASQVQPWSALIRCTLLLVFLVVGGVAVVVALYDRGVLPIAGPFVAMLVVPLIVFLRRLWLAQREERRRPPPG